MLRPSSFARSNSRMSMMKMDQTASQSLPAFFEVSLSLITSLDALPYTNSAAYCRKYLFKNHKTSRCTLLPVEKRNTFSSFCDASLKQSATSPAPRNDQSSQERIRSRNYSYRDKAFQETKVSMSVAGNSTRSPHAIESSTNKEHRPCRAPLGFHFSTRRRLWKCQNRQEKHPKIHLLLYKNI